jgi:hypothetical protein
LSRDSLDAERILEHLRLAFSQRDGGLSSALKAALSDYTLSMKASGCHCERVVIRMNQPDG